MRIYRHGIACLLSATSLSTATAAYAQIATPPAGADTAEETGIDEIIVTAQKRSERLNDVPISITAASGETLAKLNVTSPNDLGKVVPGFVYTRSAYGQPIFSIRGIGFYEEAIGIAPTVSVYIDQVPLPFARMTEGASLDVERVEALKGPQGILFGQNSTGGAINFIAAKPTQDFAAGVDLTLGRFRQAELGGFVSGPLAPNLTARLSFRVESRGNWQKSYTRNDELGKRNYGAARLLLDFKPTDRLSFELNANGWYNKSDTLAKQFRGWAPINPAPTRYTTSIGFPTYEQDLKNYPIAPLSSRAADWNPARSWKRDDEFYMASLRGDLEIGDRTTLTSISAYSNLDVTSPTDNDGTAIPDHEQVIYGKLSSFSQELRLAGTLGADDRLRWLLGGNYQRDIANDTNDLDFNGSNTGVGAFRFNHIILINNQRIKTKAVFGNLEFKITDALSAQGGIRYTDQKRGFRGCLADPGDGRLSAALGFLATLRSGTPTTIAPGACVTLDSRAGSPTFGKPLPIVTQNLNEDNLSWRVGLSWKPDSDLLVYANVTKGYKAGAFGTLALITSGQTRPVGQESVMAYEGGIKVSLLGRSLQVNGAVFRYDYRDKQLRGNIDLGPPFGNFPALTSISKSRVNGAELDTIWRPARGLTLRAAGTMVDSKVLFDPKNPASTTVPDPLGGPINIVGAAFPNTPKWQLTGDAEYEFDVSADWAAFLGVDANYRSDTRSFFGGDNNYKLPSYTLLNLRGGIRRHDGTLRLQLFVQNATNKYYKINASRVHDTVSWSIGMPITYGITVGAKF